MDVTNQLVESILHSLANNPKFKEALSEALELTLRDVIEPETTAIPKGNWLSADTAPRDGSKFIALLWDKTWHKWKIDPNAYWYKGMASPRFIYIGYEREEVELRYWAKQADRI